MREADKTGNYHYVEETEEPEEVIPHAQADFWSASRPEEGFAAKGVKIKKKKYDEGGLLEALKQRRKKIEAAKEYYKEEGENPTMYLNEEGKIIMPDVSYDTGEPVYYETELTPRQYKRFNKAAFRNYKRGLRKGDREARRQERQEKGCLL